MKKGDKIIWDSHFGYDLGEFISDKGVMYYTVSVELFTSTYSNGAISLSVNEIHPYTEELHNQMIKRYGYEKKFPGTA